MSINSYYRLPLLFIVLSYLTVIFTGCDKSHTDAPISLELHKTHRGIFISGSIDTIDAVVKNAPNDSVIYVWQFLAGDAAGEWKSIDTTHLSIITNRLTIVIPDSSVHMISLRIQCVAYGSDWSVSGALEEKIAGYIAVDHPQYRGTDNGCIQCHNAFAVAWSGTAHASLTVSTVNAVCRQCHTTGYDTILANGGADEVFTDRMNGIQCEACHGPSERYGYGGSQHLSINGFRDNVAAQQQCIRCHRTLPLISQHPMTSIDTQTHNRKSTLIRAEILASSDPNRCAGCHQTSQAIKRLNGDSVAFWNSAESEPVIIGCAVCHSAHPRHPTYKMLRLTPDLLCQRCHQPNIDLPLNSDHLPIHPQADLLTHNLTAIVYGSDSTAPLSGEHGNLGGSCAICHLYREPWQQGVSARSDHSFQVTSQACEFCHPGSGLDFIAQSQQSVRMKLDSLATRIQQHQSLSDTASIAYREARWIYQFLSRDGSYGIHNPRLTNFLLTTSLTEFSR